MSTTTETSTTETSAFVMHQKSGIHYLTCQPLEQMGFLNAFSTRVGGVSSLPEHSLNLSYREDKKVLVDENRHRFLAAIGGEKFNLITGNQTHSDKVLNIDSLEIFHGKEPECDALVSSMKNILFGIQAADCLPILVGDPQTGSVAAIHAGWRGTMAKITERTLVDVMKKKGTDPARCVVALGPSACADCYEVGADLVLAFESLIPGSREFFKNFKSNGKANLDVRAANLQQLLQAGVPRAQIHISSHCTIHQNELYFSYRAEAKGGAVMVGRQLSVIGRS